MGAPPGRGEGVKTCKKPRPGIRALSPIVYVRCRSGTVHSPHVPPASPPPSPVPSHRDLERPLPVDAQPIQLQYRSIRPLPSHLLIPPPPSPEPWHLFPAAPPLPASAVKRSGGNFLAAQPQLRIQALGGFAGTSQPSAPVRDSKQEKQKTMIMFTDFFAQLPESPAQWL